MRPESILPALVGLAVAHGDHSQKPQVSKHANWMDKHMAEEHHMTGWDTGSFFTLHDFNSDGKWQPEEIMRTYGFMHESNKDLPASRRAEILEVLLHILDHDGDGVVSLEEWREFMASGERLPDVGTGPGHHGDDEYEYEIHHWEKYHGDDTKLEDLTHPEDIEHFRKHEMMEDDQERIEAMERQPVIEDNIPLKFRKQQ